METVTSTSEASIAEEFIDEQVVLEKEKRGRKKNDDKKLSHAGMNGDGEKPKSSRGKEKGSVNVGQRLTLDLDLGTYQDFLDIHDKINQKNIGRHVTKEEILQNLLAYADDAFILGLQKNSLSEDDLNHILRTHIHTISVQ